MTRCACERDGNPIPSPVTQQQRGDKRGKLFIKVSLDCCTGAALGKASAGQAGCTSPRGRSLPPPGKVGSCTRKLQEGSTFYQHPRHRGKHNCYGDKHADGILLGIKRGQPTARSAPPGVQRCAGNARTARENSRE